MILCASRMEVPASGNSSQSPNPPEENVGGWLVGYVSMGWKKKKPRADFPSGLANSSCCPTSGASRGGRLVPRWQRLMILRMKTTRLCPLALSSFSLCATMKNRSSSCTVLFPRLFPYTHTHIPPLRCC